MTSKVSQMEVNDFIMKLRRRHVEGSLECAKQTAALLRSVISAEKGKSGEALITCVREVGKRIMAAKPLEMATGNIVRRVLYMIRDEMQQALISEQTELSGSTSDFNALHNTSFDYGPNPGGDLGSLSPARTSGVPGQPAFYHTSHRTLSLHNLMEITPDSLEDEEDSGRGGASSPDSSALGAMGAGASLARRSESTEELGDSLGGGGGREQARGGGGGKGGKFSRIKAGVIEALNELIDELEEINNNIAEQAMEHIHAREVILTFAASKTVEAFLTAAAAKRTFQVVVSEGAPTFLGQGLARTLAAGGIHTTCIPDAAIFAMMARVNKVIVGCHAVLANGGVIAPVGMHMVALAAARHAVPFVVLTGLHKLTPVFPHDPNITMNEFKSPAQVLDIHQVVDCLYRGAGGDPELLVMNPGFDYIPPHLVQLYITDTGGHNPSYVYRLLAEYYSPQDYDLASDATF